MVEKLTKEDIISKLQNAHKQNPCYNDDINKINWAIVGSFSSFEELLDHINTPTQYKSILKNLCPQIFSPLRLNQEKNHQDVNIFFYKYLYILALTNPTSESYIKIKAELFDYLIELSRKKIEEGLSDTFKLCKLVTFFCCSLMTFTLFTIVADAFREKQSNDIEEDENKIYDIEKISIDTETKIKNLFSDYDSIVSLFKMIKEVLLSFGEKSSKAMIDLDEKNSDQLVYLYYNDKDLLGLKNLETTTEINDNIKYTDSWFMKIPELNRKDLEEAKTNFTNLNLNEVIFNSLFYFS